ncbi:hypothetical protein N9L68_07020 [bacterium]|nr:hypothetical protein [bacterium]
MDPAEHHEADEADINALIRDIEAEEERRQIITQAIAREAAIHWPYGTRDAAINLQEEVAREMRKRGFRGGKHNLCLYCHEGRNLRTVLHGDDFASVGKGQTVSLG